MKEFLSNEFCAYKNKLHAQFILREAGMELKMDRNEALNVPIGSGCPSCSGGNCHQGESNDNKKLTLLGFGFILFLIALFAPMQNIIRVSLYIISYLIVGGEIILYACKNIIKGKVFDENFLMSIASMGAFFIDEYPEGVAVMLFYRVGELLQDYAVSRSKGSIAALMDIRPDFANVIRDNKLSRMKPEEVLVGDYIIVKAGEKIPLDGIVAEGESFLDTTALTGESMPKEAKAGSEALAGFVNIDGLLRIKVTKKYEDSTAAKVLRLVESAAGKKAKTEKFITKFARYYTPIVVISAAIIAFIPPLVIPNAQIGDWVYRALVFLVISCPCALVLSVPISFFGGIGGASKCGILVKGGNFLEALAHTDIVVFDKTGTLTKGVFEVDKIMAVNKNNEELLEMAAYAEYYSNHPISQSIIRAHAKQVNQKLIEQSREIAGQGTEVVVSGKTILAGNEMLLKGRGIDFQRAEAEGTIVYLALEGKYMGYISILDKIKEDSYEMIPALKKYGVKKTIMLTGDSDAIGKSVADRLNIDEVYTQLLPDGKVQKLEELLAAKPKKSKLAYVGDGINDAPVLARADIGIAMGGIGSDAAIEAADAVIMTDEPSRLIDAIGVSRKTIKIAKQNIVFALGIKLIILLLGVLGYASMWLAVFADVGVSVLAILNAVRPLYYKQKGVKSRMFPSSLQFK